MRDIRTAFRDKPRIRKDNRNSVRRPVGVNVAQLRQTKFNLVTLFFIVGNIMYVFQYIMVPAPNRPLNYNAAAA